MGGFQSLISILKGFWSADKLPFLKKRQDIETRTFKSSETSADLGVGGEPPAKKNLNQSLNAELF